MALFYLVPIYLSEIPIIFYGHTDELGTREKPSIRESRAFRILGFCLLTSHRRILSIVLKVNEPTVAVRFRFVTLDGNCATINSCSTGFAEKSRFGDIVMSSRPF